MRTVNVQFLYCTCEIFYTAQVTALVVKKWRVCLMNLLEYGLINDNINGINNGMKMT